MNELSLFSGGGGGLLGSKLLGWRAVGYVEFNPYCQREIRQRIEDGVLDRAPIFGDVRAFLSEGYARSYQGLVDVVSGGFPCQPFSVAGKQAGADDPRNMWPQTIEVLRQVRPRYAFLENVPGLLAHAYFGTILGDLAESGFHARWCVLSAADVGAPHLRKRLWILADATNRGREWRGARSEEKGSRRPFDLPSGPSKTISNSLGAVVRIEQRRLGRESWAGAVESGEYGEAEPVADPFGLHGHDAGHGTGEVRGLGPEPAEVPGRLPDPGRPLLEEREGTPGERPQPATGGCDWWLAEPDVGRVAHGVAARVERLKALGNGQVPLVAATAWQLLARVK